MAGSSGKKTGTKSAAKKQAAKKSPAAKAAAKTKAAAPKKKAAASKKKAAAPKKKAAASKTTAKAPARKKAPAKKSAAVKSSVKRKSTAKAKTTAKAKPKRTATGKTAASKRKAVKSETSAPSKTKPTSALTAAASSRPGTSGVESPFRAFTPHQPKKGESYMSDEQIAHFRSILSQWRQDLMEEVDRTVHHMRDEAANFPDPADRATQEEEFSIELRTRDRERKLIKKIDQTLERLDQGDFGYCDTCGVEIGLRRLEARPTATQCVDCKALDEIKERQLHG